MKIILFPGGSFIGGLEMVTLSLMQQLQFQGHECFAIVSGWNDGHYPTKLSGAGIPHRSIKLGRFYLGKPLWNLDGLGHFPHAAWQLRTVIRDIRPDLVVLTGIEFAMTVLQILPKSLPVVLHVHDVPNRNWNSWMGRYVLRRVNGMITVSDFIRERGAEIAKNALPVVTVHNGVSKINAIPARTHPRVRIGIIGQLIPRKKHEVLADAVALLSSEERAQLEVRIYGANTTDYAREIALKIETVGLTDCFHWMGFISSQADIYGDLDIVVAPAVREPFGTTVLEAGSWELPVIAANSGGFPEMVHDGETGLLVEPDDPADLARALRRLMDPAERRRLGRNARQHVMERFSVPAMGRNFIKALHSFGLKA